jgi:hypothetical protein
MRAWTFVLLLTAASATPDIRLQVRPRIAAAPATVHLRVWVERRPENRWLTVAAEGPHYYRSSVTQLAGDSAQRVHDYWWHGLPCGSYVVIAQVRRNDGRTSQARDDFRLVGGVDCPAAK